MTVDSSPEAAAPAQPARRHRASTLDDAELARVRGSLSPSRAADFKTCPLLYRFRTIDRLPEQPTPDQARGTLVHAVLERLFDLPAGERTPEAAVELLAPQWQRLREESEELAGLFEEEADAETWLASARELLAGYFTVEDPRRLEPEGR
jgi:putative RecB family exonuclease